MILPEELRKAERLHESWGIREKCLPSQVVASFLEKARKQREAELLSLRNEQRRELKERCKATAYYGQQGFLQLPLQDVVNLIAAVLGGEEKHGDDEE